MVGITDSELDLPSTPSRPEPSLYGNPKSTTPSHEPPSYLTNVSTTPLGPPPRSIYGSSFNAGNTFPRARGTPLKNFALPQSSPPREEDEDADMDQTFMSRAPNARSSAFASSFMSSPRGLKRSRSGKVQARQESDLPAIARGLAKQAKQPQLHEPDSLIVRGEEIISALDNKIQQQQGKDRIEPTLASGAASITNLWTSARKPSTKEGSIGPATDDPLAKAVFVGSLLLQLHHPHSTKPTQPPANSRTTRPSAYLQGPSHAISLPRALLDWLETHHNPFPDDFTTIHLHQPSPSNNDSFWDVVFASALRGKLDRVIRLLKDAGWEYAITALDDGAEEPGYDGKQLENTQAVVARCTSLLENCPALKHGDWDIKGADWTLYRQRIRQAMHELQAFAEGDGNEREPSRQNVFATRSEFDGNMSLSAASRRAKSKVPWTVYESLNALYGQLLGQVDELIVPSQDWLEASIFLAVWWDGEDDNAPAPGAVMNKSGLRKSIADRQRPREADVAPLAAYRNRLADALGIVTDQPEDPVFQVDTLDPVQVAIACAIEDNVESVLALIRSWSISVTAVTAELAALGEWLPQAKSRSRGLVEQGFSSEDLMVLSHGHGSLKPVGEIERDAILCQYADLLSHKASLTTGVGGIVKEGWELAVAILGRLDDSATAQRRIGELLEDIELTDNIRADKVLSLCSDLGLAEQARAISERYADGLAESSQAYGQALVFYARAHAAAKLKDTLSLLTSLSLIQSAAVPATAQLDQHLSSLLRKDRSGLVQLARSDPEATKLLSSNLSGYATLRKFYDLRDQDVIPTIETEHLRPLARKREAAKALMAVIESAADCIRGGLFDPDVESAVAPEALLTLLGETLPLLASEQRVFTKTHIFTLLRVVEDFSTAPARIQDRAAELFHASGKSFHEGKNLGDLLKKSRSDLSSGSAGSGIGGSYDMLASSYMLLSQEKLKTESSPDTRRGWDWRQGLKGIEGTIADGSTVLSMLRLALATEVGRAWGVRG